MGTAVHSECIVGKRFCAAEMCDLLLVDLTEQIICRNRTMARGIRSIGYGVFRPTFNKKK